MRIFDLDGVLCRRDTMAAVVTSALHRRPHRWPGVALAAAVGAGLPVTGRARPAVNRRIVRFALAGLSRNDYERLAAHIGRRLAARAADRDLVRLAASETGETVVVTATERVLAESFLAACGLDEATLVASEIDWARAAPVFAHHNVGPAKVDALGRMGVDAAGAVFYTDSASDIPLARVAGRTVLVRPSKRSVRAFRRAGVRAQLWTPDVTPR